MDLKMIGKKFVICQLENFDEVDFNQDYTFTAKTKEEYSVICPEEMAPKKCIQIEHGWNCFRIAEDAAFAKYGMIVFLADVVAKQKTGILVVATYDTDYILIKEEKMEQVKEALVKEGCRFI